MKQTRSSSKIIAPGPLLVSACLLGRGCRYDGGYCRHEEVLRLAAGRELIPICPESMGGLESPRPPAEIAGGDGDDVLAGRAGVVDKLGRNVTEAFIRGAEAVLRVAKERGARTALLKERSPSCGARWIYDGSFSGRKVPGQGVAAALLARNGIEVHSEEDLIPGPPGQE